MAQIDNYGAPVAGARGGATVFMDDAFVRGSLLVITNFVAGESGVAGTVGGTTEFRDRSHAIPSKVCWRLANSWTHGA